MNTVVNGAFQQVAPNHIEQSVSERPSQEVLIQEGAGVTLTVILQAPVEDPYALNGQAFNKISFSIPLSGTMNEISTAVSEELLSHIGTDVKFDPIILIKGATGTPWHYKSAGRSGMKGLHILEEIENVLTNPENRAGFIPKVEDRKPPVLTLVKK